MKKYSSAFIILAATLWGIDGILLRPNLYTLPVPLVVFVETAILATIFSLFINRDYSHFKKLKAKDWLSFLGVALFGGAIGTMAITKALFYVNFVNLSIVVLIQKLQPVVAISLAALLLKERPARSFYLWSFLAVVGAFFMTFGLSLPEINGDDKTAIASIFALLATFGFASSTVLSKRALKNIEYKAATQLRFIMTSSIMLIILLFSGELSSITTIDTSQWYTFATIVALTGGPGLLLYYFGLKNTKATIATIAELAFPLTAVLLEYWLRGNILSAVQWVGLALLMVSIKQVVGKSQN